MTRGQRIAGYIGIGALTGLVLALVATQLLTRSGWGMERARGFALDWLRERVHGTVSVGRVSGGGLLRGVVLHDVSIIDRKGRPFLQVDSARASYDWRTLLAGEIVLDRVVLYRPHVFLEQLPGDTAWNYEYLFADTTPKNPLVPRHRTLVLFHQTRIIAGEATVLRPFGDAQRILPQDTARLILERFPTGLAKLMRFRGIDAQLGRVVWESPQDTGRYFEVRRASATGYVFRKPLTLRNAIGRIAMRDSVVSLDFSRIDFPASTAAVFGTVVSAPGQNYYDLQIDAERFAFRDLQWLSDRLPADGGGSGRLRIQSQRAVNSTLWYAEGARIHTGRSSIAGSLGMVLGDTTYFTRVDLRASPLDVALLRKLLPGSVPIDGVLVGTVEIKGPLSALETSGDVRIEPARPSRRDAAGSVLRWSGVLDVRRGRLGARALRADLQGFDLALLNAWQPQLRLGGVVSGEVTAAGQLASDLRFTADLRHLRADGDTSWLVGSGSLDGAAEARSLELQLDARPFALAELARRYPALAGLQGKATGHMSLRGPFDRLDYDAALNTAAGPVRLRGQLARGRDGPRYSGSAELSAFQLDALSPHLPQANLNGNVAFDVTGTGLGSLRGDVRVQLDSAHLFRVPLQRSLMQARIADGMLLVDTLSAVTLAGEFTARGSLGLIPERTGSVSLDLRNTAVGLLEADIFGEAASTEPEAPRLAGTLRAQGELRGNLRQLDASAEGDVRQLVIGPLRVARGAARLTASALGTDSMRAELSASADSAAAWGRLLDTASLSVSHARATTAFALQGSGRGMTRDRLQLQGWARRTTGGATAAITRLLVGDTAPWQLSDSVLVQLAGGSLTVSPLAFRPRDGEGALRAEGLLGWSADPASAHPLDFRLQLERVPFPDVLRAIQSPAAGAGQLDGSLRITGNTLAPLVDADLTATGLAYDEVNVQHGFLELAFADQAAALRIEAEHGGRRVLSGGGGVPLDLRFTSVPQRRLARPLDLGITADSLPAAQVLPFLDGFRRVEGTLNGTITAAGTTLDPALSGGLQAKDLAATWNATGVRYTDVNGSFELISDRVVKVAARAQTRDPRRDAAVGTGVVSGTLDFARLSNPAFDLRFRADNVLASQRRDVEAVMTGDIHLGGRYAAPEVTASLRVDRGAMYLDEVYRQFFVVQLDSASMFQFVDTSLVAGRRVLPVSRNPFLDNLRIDSTRVSVGAGSWLRSQDMDVEVNGDLTVAFDRRADDLRLSGTLDVVRGTYQLVYPPLQARRFRVSEGTIEFTGLPGIDPNLSISAVYKGRAGNEPLDIIAQVNGTLQNPRVRLTSDEEPPISESDLASYLFFGVPTWEWGTLVGVQSGPGDARGTLTGLGRTVAPSLLGYASSGLQTLAQGAGLLDYVSLTAADALPGTEAGRERTGFFSGAQLELGRYFTPSVYVGVSQRLANATTDPGVRLEWRFRPTATLELFSEDRFARGTASFGYNQEGMVKRVLGFFLFREWGY